MATTVEMNGTTGLADLGEGERTTSCDESTTTTLLEATAEYCQQLAERLRKKEAALAKHQTIPKVSPPSPPASVVDPLATEERIKYQQTTEENIRLKAVIQDVTEANKRWQKYNHERQAYMQKLMDTIHDLRAQVSQKSSEVVVVPPSSSSAGAGGCNASTAAAAHASPAPGCSFDEYLALQQNCERANEEVRRMTREVEDVRKRMAHLTNQLEKAKSDHEEHVELLEMQVRAHRDDWEAERREKKDVLAREVRLGEELRETKMRFKELQRERHRQESCLCHARNGMHTEPIAMGSSRHSSPAAYNIPPDLMLIPRSSSQSRNIYRDDDSLAIDGVAVRSPSPTSAKRASPTSSPPPSQPSTATTHAVLRERTSNNNGVKTNGADFRCPECHEVFPSGTHYDFLMHFERCQRHGIQ